MTRKPISIIFIPIVIILILPSFLIFADWIGFKEVIVGEWGKESGQFFYESQDTFDAFPKNIGIDKNNNIIISDEGNKRIYVYSQNGKLIYIIQKPIGLSDIDFAFGKWPGKIILLPYDNLIIFSCDYKQILGGYQPLKQCIVNYKEKILSKIEVAETFAALDGLFLLKDNRYYKYSSIGKLHKTYDTLPLELGEVKEENLGKGKYKVTVTYPDKTWEMIQNYGACPGYQRDACGNLYCGCTRHDLETKEIATIDWPKDNIEEIPSNIPGIDPDANVIEEYGSPVLAPNGDVYTWKRTPDKYSIIKWVWVDGPECPQYLEVTPTKDSLKFKWQKPEKDADKVTGYQLLQSYNICGPFRQTALIKKDLLSYEDKDVEKGATYYYVLKAVRGKDYSGNSNKVCGQLE